MNTHTPQLPIFLILGWLLATVAVSFNACDEWPDATEKCIQPLCDCSQVIELDLEGLDLSSIPTWIGTFVNLQRLDLSANLLTDLPTEIGNLKKLYRLDLNSNKLASLPTELGLMTQLRTLLVFKNEIQSIPTEIGNLIRLNRLSASNNRISSLPTELGTLFSLDTLDLKYNQITSIPTEIGFLNLDKLDFRHNPYNCPVYNPDGFSPTYNNAINSINSTCNQLCVPNPCTHESTCYLLEDWSDYGCYHKKTACDEWEVATCYCTLPQCDCSNVTTLNLSYQNLTYIPTWIGAFTELEYLYLSGNKLKCLPTEIGSLGKLKELFANLNLLEGFPTEIANLWDLTYFDVEFNPFECPLENSNCTSNYVYNDAINYVNSICNQEGFCEPNPCFDLDDECRLLPDWSGSFCEEEVDDEDKGSSE